MLNVKFHKYVRLLRYRCLACFFSSKIWSTCSAYLLFVFMSLCFCIDLFVCVFAVSMQDNSNTIKQFNANICGAYGRLAKVKYNDSWMRILFFFSELNQSSLFYVSQTWS
jgi:hypothetical protein